MLKLIIGVLCLLPISTANCNILPDADGKDDSETIVAHIQASLPDGGLISIEQHTGRLLFNPEVAKLRDMTSKKRFFMPALVVNQKRGLHLISEMPLSCFTVSADELAAENYKGLRQHETLRYIRDVKNFTVSKALICETVGTTAKNWKQNLDLDNDVDPFVFEEYTSNTGEKFYYYVNENGGFEMYM